MKSIASNNIQDAVRPPRHLVVMGVSGSGKTTLSRMLAADLGLPMAEADEFHPPQNIAKMAAGISLNDSDRWPWLHSLRAWMSENAAHGSVVTCSALRRSYRDVLRTAGGETVFLHVILDVPRLHERLQHRCGHFMPPALLASQLHTLEPLESHEAGVEITNDGTEEELLKAARAWLDAGGSPRCPKERKDHDN